MRKQLLGVISSEDVRANFACHLKEAGKRKDKSENSFGCL